MPREIVGKSAFLLSRPLINPSGMEVALHCDADMVRAIVGARQIKFLSGPAAANLTRRPLHWKQEVSSVNCLGRMAS